MTNFLETGVWGVGVFWGGGIEADVVLNKKDVTGLKQKRHSLHECKSITKLGLQNC